MPQPIIFVYQTVCEHNGKSYVGVHRTGNINDGYIGCGISKPSDAKKNYLFHKAVNKHGYKNFNRHILNFYDTYEEALQEEKYIVNSHWVNSKSNYNMALGGEGNTTLWMDEERKILWKKKIKEGADKWVKSGGLEQIREKSKIAKRSRLFGHKNPRFNNGNPSVERSVIQYDLAMKEVNRFPTITAAFKSTNISISSITICCKGVTLTTGGSFIFRYEKYKEKELVELNKNLKRTPRDESEKNRLRIVRESFLLKGRKDSIKFKHTVTGEVVNGVTSLNKRYPEVCFKTIKEKSIKDGYFKEYLKIN